VTILQLILGGKNPYELCPNFLEGYQQAFNKHVYLSNVIVNFGYKLVDYIPSSCESSLRAFLKKCLKKGRPTAESLLTHQFLKKYSVSSLKNEEFSQETSIVLQYLMEKQNGAKREEQNAPQIIENLTSITFANSNTVISRKPSSLYSPVRTEITVSDATPKDATVANLTPKKRNDSLWQQNTPSTSTLVTDAGEYIAQSPVSEGTFHEDGEGLNLLEQRQNDSIFESIINNIFK